jgi:cytochrome b561
VQDVRSEVGAYNKLAKSSMVFNTPYDSKTMTQMHENAEFFHKVVGIRVVFPRLVWRLDHPTKPIKVRTPRTKLAMPGAWRMLSISALTVLARTQQVS